MEVQEALDRIVAGLAGHQAICLYEFYRMLGGTGDPDAMPIRRRIILCDLLHFLGYRERTVIRDGSGRGTLMWVRDAWPIDLAPLEETKRVRTYRKW